MSPTNQSPWMPRGVRVSAVHQETSDTATYDLEDPHGRPLPFRPGQFNMLYVPGYGESAISVSSDPTSVQTLSHTIRVVGNVTRAIARSQIGDVLLLRGPFGAPWPIEDCQGHDIVIATGGIGLAPLRPVIYQILADRDKYGSVTLLYGARNPAGLLYTAEYDDWRKGDIRVEVIVDQADPDWTGDVGVVPTLFNRLNLDAGRTRVLTCGPEIMMRFVALESLSRDIAKQHIYLSMERRMSCAIGLCGQCQLGPAFLCKDGPVFTYLQLEPYLHLDDL